MRTRRWLVTAAVGILGIAAGLGVDSALVGRELDAHRGVTVFDNGLLFFRSRGRHVSGDGYYLGQKWQCVEFIKRFYYQVHGHRMPDAMGHAKDFFDPSVRHRGLNTRRGMLQFENGGDESPAPEDLIVFRDTTFGHVAIVTRVTSNSVEVIQQNIFGHPRQLLELQRDGGRFRILSPRAPAGWLRLPPRANQLR